MASVGITRDDIRQLLACFYVNNGLVVSREPDHLQQVFNILVKLFKRDDLKTNAKNTEAMAFVPRRIRTSFLDEIYRAQMNKEFRRDRGRGTVECDLCGKVLWMGLLQQRLEKKHNTYRSFVVTGEATAPQQEPQRLKVRYYPA